MFSMRIYSVPVPQPRSGCWSLVCCPFFISSLQHEPQLTTQMPHSSPEIRTATALHVGVDVERCVGQISMLQCRLRKILKQEPGSIAADRGST